MAVDPHHWSNIWHTLVPALSLSAQQWHCEPCLGIILWYLFQGAYMGHPENTTHFNSRGIHPECPGLDMRVNSPSHAPYILLSWLVFLYVYSIILTWEFGSGTWSLQTVENIFKTGIAEDIFYCPTWCSQMSAKICVADSYDTFMWMCCWWIWKDIQICYIATYVNTCKIYGTDAYVPLSI